MGDDVLAVRLDSDGDVLLTGPALRALAATAGAVDLLCSSAGQQAGRLLPGIRDVVVFDAPWTGYRPPALDLDGLGGLFDRLGTYDRVVVFTSFHQSPLPMALLARMAGVRHVSADCTDYPGSLLDVRHRRREVHEVEAALDLAVAAGGRAEDDGRLAVRAEVTDGVACEGYVVLHPGASVSARALAPEHAGDIAVALEKSGRRVLITGGPDETALTATISARAGVDLGGRTDLPALARLLAGAECAVVPNTGPAHLAAAVGTPVVSLFAPVVPAERWAPYGVPHVVLGDQGAPCAGSRARVCPVPGHPCLSGIDPDDVVAAVDRLVGEAG